MKFMFVFLIFTSLVNASELCHETLHPELHDLIQLEKGLNWEAASDAQIRNAPCTRKEPFTEAEMKAWMSSHDSLPRLNQTINGVSFENESFENLEAFRHLTTFATLLGEKDLSKHKDFTSSCKKVECAVKEILGQDIGLQLLYMQRRYGLNGSHVIKDESWATKWRKEELDTVLLALSDLPDGIMPIQASRTMIHAPRNHDNGRTIANAVITVYQLWNKQSPEQQRSTIVHELGHAIAGITDLDDHDHWHQHSGWAEKTKIVNGKPFTEFESSNKDAIVSQYGLTNPHEDFAESVVAYRYNPHALKAASPGKYELIKKTIFDNVEYTSEQACANPERYSQSHISELNKNISTWEPSDEELLEISNRCSVPAVESLGSTGSVDLSTPEFLNCYKRSVNEQTSRLIEEKLGNDPDKEFLRPIIKNARLAIPPERVNAISEKARNYHVNNLRDQLLKGLQYQFFCDNKMSLYSYQQFNKEKVGIDTYRYRSDLNLTAVHACKMRNSATPEEIVSAMIK